MVDRIKILALAALISACASQGPDNQTLRGSSCDDVRLDIVVTDREELRLNGRTATLDMLRAHAREKAIACEGATPSGTYEGPNVVTVTASLIWPILEEELPDLELEMTHRGPGGHG